MKNLFSALALLAILSAACGPAMTFEEQIINDLQTKIPSGICEKFPKGTVLSNVQVGEIVDIGLDGMTDVSYEFDYEINGESGHEEGAMLYLKRGNRYVLASMGSDCDFELQ
jgi:outer membrane lipoprotein-sorting protein